MHHYLPRCVPWKAIAIFSLAFQNAQMIDSRLKILTAPDLINWRNELRLRRRLLVATNGCFDLLHAGHVTYLEAARNLGDALVVGVNGDAAVRTLKGPDRPLNTAEDRALVIASLACVDAVFIFPEVRATSFISISKPDIYVKGGDYSLDTLNPDERQLVEGAGGIIHLLPLVPGKSTTVLVKRIKDTPPPVT
jgi:D-glycero-beta-D-manno-heptose 1-phosphate adenylyltransferase